MRFYQNVDYYIYRCDFPCMGAAGAAVANTDGTVNIYINALYSAERQEKTIRHELRHFAKNHLWDDRASVVQKESEANSTDDGVVFGDEYEWVEIPEKEKKPPERKIAVFKDLDSLKRFMEYHLQRKL